MPSSLVDLENLFIDFAWKNYERTTSWIWKKKRENVLFDISWNRVKVREEEPVYQDSTTIIRPHIIFQTRYNNKSGGVQTNRFSTEKETTSTVSVKLMKGFTRSVDAGISLPLPKDGKPEEAKPSQGDGQTPQKEDGHPHVSSEFGNNVQIRCDETTVIEKKQKWTVDTTITSREGHVTEAQLMIDELQTTTTFQMDVKLKGTIVLTLRDKKNPNKVIDTIIGDIKTLIEDRKPADPNLAEVKIEDSCDWVTWPFKGGMEIQYGVRESVITSIRDN